MKKVIKIVIIIMAFIIILLAISRLVEPKYATSLIEGNFISEYYDEEKIHEVIFIGDCEMYSNFSPMEIYEQEGITSFVRGTPQQLIWQSYSILEETLTYEKPKIVVLSVNCMKYGKPVSEAYNRLTIDKMRWSKQKIDIINSSKTEEENFASYVFPLLRYHARWEELTDEDFKYFWSGKENTFDGYYMIKDVKPVENLPTKKALANYKFDYTCYTYLDKITKLCKDNGITLILVKAPSVYPYWYEEYDTQMEDYAKQNNITYINLRKKADEIGLDYSKDTYDSGMHLNLYGAQKLSTYFAKMLKNNYKNLTDFRTNDKINKIYEQKLKEYHIAIDN